MAGILLAASGVEPLSAKDEPPGEQASEVQAHLRDLSHADYQVRWKALDALAKLGPNAAPAVPALIQRLESEDRYRVIGVLGAIGPSAASAAPALLNCLAHTLSIEDKLYRDESTEAIAIIETLVKIGATGSDTVRLLRKALKDQVSTIRYFSAHALGEIGPNAHAAIPDLEALLNDHEYIGLYEYPYGKDVADIADRTLEKLREQSASDAAKMN